MGVYTEFHFYTTLKEDTPKSVIHVLKYMLDREFIPSDLPNHPLFETRRWHYMLSCTGGNFDAETRSRLFFDDDLYYLNIRCRFKNYDDEINLFTDWIRPYLNKRTDDFLGYYRHEESQVPILIYA